MSGVVGALDLAGGGLIAAKFTTTLRNSSPAMLRYWSQLAGILNSGARSIVVPLIVDFLQPASPAFFTKAPSLAGGVVFNTPAGDNPDTIQPAALNAGTVTLNAGSRTLTGGEWFGVVHPTKLQRAYVVTDIDAVTANADGSSTVTVGIRPPLREAVSALTAINFNRPQCVMRLSPGTTMQADVDASWWATPEMSLIESFGLV